MAGMFSPQGRNRVIGAVIGLKYETLETLQRHHDETHPRTIMSKPVNDIWKDPMVQEALKDGRSANDIRVMECPKCSLWGYWNEGSHFSCRFCANTWRFCKSTWLVTREMAEDSITLADTVTVTTDGYDNETLANP